MSQSGKTSRDDRSSTAKSAVESGLSALAAASSGAKAGAKLAVGTLFAGANVLLDLGVQVTRKLPLRDEPGNEFHLRTAGGDIPVVARTAGSCSGAAAALGWWSPDDAVDQRAGPSSAAPGPAIGEDAIADGLRQVTRNLYIVDCDGRIGVGLGGRAVIGADTAGLAPSYPLRAVVPALHPRMLGDRGFREAHGLRYAYVAGAMANGISSESLVEAMGQAGMLAFFGAAGLSLQRIEAAIDRLQHSLGDRPFGFNLIHNPNEPEHESAVADLYLRRAVRLVSASAYLDLTPPLVRYRLSGIRRDAHGRVVCPNQVIAKVSRIEVARKFFSPPPPNLLKALVDAGDLTAEQARMAESVPVAQDLTVEADSGGHTDNASAVALVPTMIALRDGLQARFGYDVPLRVGAAGGISTPASTAAAFAMGAAYVLTGSVNQACVESGTSDAVREMLARASQADVTMAPAADMFEMGVKVQVLKWGTMFAVRARKLYELYRTYDSLEALPRAQRTILERDYFRCPLDEAWSRTRRFFEGRDARQLARAETDPKHKMALVFRSYLGQSSTWANAGEPSRKVDYQIWCGPAMGAFNEWAAGSFFESCDRRHVVCVAMNLLVGAAVLMRANWLGAQGIAVPPAAQRQGPMEMEEIQALLDEDRESPPCWTLHDP